MKTETSLTATMLAICLLAPSAAAQQRPPAGTPQAAPPPSRQQQTVRQDDEDDVVRITTNLVQTDVIVTDKDGRQVRDLRPEDFTIYEDAKAQQITNFSYVSTGETAAGGREAVAPPARTRGRDMPSVAPAPLRREQVHRTIALVIDDLKIPDMFGVGTAQDALRKFINEQMRAGDLVGIYGTRGGSGALQQFTSDRAQLHRAIDALRWLPPDLSMGMIDQTDSDDEHLRDINERIAERNRELIAYGALNTLYYVIHGMQMAPGRKSVVLFSEGVPYERRLQGSADDLLFRVIESANRASTAIYTVDIRGVSNPVFDANYTAERASAPPDGATATAATALAPVLGPADPAVRRFRPGQTLAYSFQVYHPALEASPDRPVLTAQAILFYRGERVLTAPEAPLARLSAAERSRPQFGSTLRIAEDAEPGQYVLQVVVTDAADKGKRRATRWIDFEVVR